MNEICIKIWDRDLSVRKWAALNGFSYSTTLAVINGARGSWGVGVSKKILAALVNQGLMTAEEAKERVK